MRYVALEKLHELFDGYRRVFRVNGTEVLLVQEAGRCHLLVNQCPHQNAPLERASINDNTLRCPRHGIMFDLDSGKPLNGASCSPLRRVPLIYEGNTVGIEAPDLLIDVC